MIARPVPDWQSELAQAVRSPGLLLRLLGLPDRGHSPQAADNFPLRVPHSYIQRMRAGDRNDPLLRQVLPVEAETRAVAGFGLDPVGDLAADTGGGILRKYHGRALLIVTGACAIHCRYCFRRHFPYAERSSRAGEWSRTLEELANSPDVNEVILSGGDPLMLADERLARLVDALAAIPHLRRLRIHTRLPVVLPSRVTSALIDTLLDTRLDSVVVLHINHANELDLELRTATRRLRDSGLPLLNQAVLLAGVNERSADQIALNEALFSAGVLPYYLHQLDPVQGAAHFAVADADAIALQRHLRDRLPGYLLPGLVREQAGALSKLPLS